MPVAHQRQRRLEPPEYQTPATLNQANPVQNTWYDILPTTTNVRIFSIGVNVEDTNETLEVQIIIDGETASGVGNACTHSTNYYVHIIPDAINRLDRCILNSGNSELARHGAPILGRSVQVQVRKTTNAGVGNLTGIVIYGRYTETDI